MNRPEYDLLIALSKGEYINQRLLAEETGCSLGMVNQALRALLERGYLDNNNNITSEAREFIKKYSPRNAIILAAGFGMRMVPINTENPKALLSVHGEIMIERIIDQLHGVGIQDITVVVGFLKEKFEYLIDQMGVKLVYNKDYAKKNNLHSLALVADRIDNTYVIPGDLYCDHNPFSESELYSWYLVGDKYDEESTVRVNRKLELVPTGKSKCGNRMLGISYITGNDGKRLRNTLLSMDRESKNDGLFWEEALFSPEALPIQARIDSADDVVEINTYEQLREIDEDSNHLKSDTLDIIAAALKVSVASITNIEVMKKGMTNRSFMFDCSGNTYIMRIPGEGTASLINRREEANVYEAIRGRGISDDVIYINPENGYKITQLIRDSRVCDPSDRNDLEMCMGKLREFHEMNLKVDHEFDIFERIEFYESLWPSGQSMYKDYASTKEKVFSNRSYIKEHESNKCLTHIDAVADNFLILPDGTVRLIDWEYAAMQDPHVDIAMFCIYSMFSKDQTDELIDIYFKSNCPAAIRKKIYCYISACGLLWSNWCEYKSSLGIEFGEYSLSQYRFAKEYFNYAIGG